MMPTAQISKVLSYTTQFKAKMHSLIAEHCRRKQACAVLDIGCGHGEDLHKVRSAFPDAFVCGMDLFFNNIAEASPGPEVCFVQSHAERLPFRDRSFDVIFSSEVIEHLTCVDDFLKEVRRTLKDDGIFIITTPSRWNYVTLIGRLIPKKFKETARRWVYAIARGSDPKPHVREYLAGELDHIFRTQGFEVCHTAFGVMRVPAWTLFDKLPFLLLLWRCLDLIVGCFPVGKDLKANFVMAVKKRPPQDEKTLVINLGGMGDLLLSQPALKALKSFYSQGYFVMLVAEKSREVVESFKLADRIVTLDIGYGGVASWIGMVSNLWELFALRQARFTLAVNMRTLVSEASAKKMKFMLDVIDPALRAGRDTQGRGSFFDIGVCENDIGEKYERDYDVATVNALGIPVDDRSISFEVPYQAKEKVEAFLEKHGVKKSERLIGLHPGGMPSRRWPIENYAQLVSGLEKNFSGKFVVTGGCEEAYLFGYLKEKTQAPLLDASGILSFLELAALIQRCQLFISNDTGPMHVSAILGTPLVAILGPGDIIRFDPRNISEKVKVLYKKAHCAPCNKKECVDLACLKSITPEDVFGAAKALLANNEAGI